MLYSIFYNEDNGYRIKTVKAIICSTKPLKTAEDVRNFMYTHGDLDDDTTIKTVYRINPLETNNVNSVYLRKVID